MEEAILRLQNEYLLQQGIEELTADNREVYGLDESGLQLIFENKTAWLVMNTEYDVLNIVYKDSEKRMESVEIY
jgi:hypothetical protein